MISKLRELCDLFVEYSFTIVICALFILILLYVIKRNNDALKELQDQNLKNNEELQKKNMEAGERNAEQLNEFTNKLMDQFIKTMNEKNINEEEEDEHNLVKTFFKLQSALKNDCYNTMSDINASRLAIYLFHNGVHSTHGVNFLKISCICEKVLIGSGIRERTVEHSGIPINLFDTMIESLVANNSYIIMNDEHLENSNQKIFVSSKKVKYVLTVSILDMDNTIMGFVLAEMTDNFDEEKSKEEIKKLTYLSNKIVPVLSCLDYVETNINKFNHDRHE